MKIYIGIPARFGSTRFPGKPLKDINGYSMLEHCYKRACLVKNIESVFIASADEKISNFCGIPFDITLLKPTIFGKDYYGNNHKGKKMIGISQENIGRWKHRISKFEAGVIEYWLGDIMDKLNYKKKIKSEYSMDCFSTFYQWYNYKYFYYDSFKN